MDSNLRAENRMLKEQLEIILNENKQLKEKLNTYESPDDMTLMFMWCDEKAKDKIKELTQVLLDIKEYIKEKRKSGEIFYINEVEKMINKALGDKE